MLTISVCLLCSVAVFGLVGSAPVEGQGKKSLVSSHINVTFSCFANTMTVCGTEFNSENNAACKIEGFKLTAYAFRQLSNTIMRESKKVMEDVENKPNLLPKYTKNDYDSSEINEYLNIKVPSALTPGQEDIVSVRCNGTWKIASLVVNRKKAECDSSVITCSQVHAIFNNNALLEVAKNLNDSATENDRQAEVISTNLAKKKASRTFSDGDAEEEDTSGSVHHTIMKSVLVPLPKIDVKKVTNEEESTKNKS